MGVVGGFEGPKTPLKSSFGPRGVETVSEEKHYSTRVEYSVRIFPEGFIPNGTGTVLSSMKLPRAIGGAPAEGGLPSVQSRPRVAWTPGTQGGPRGTHKISVSSR